MIERVKQFIQLHNLIPSNCRTVLVAVSGGIDSCVLLDVLFRMQKEFNYQLKIVHFNHKIRGEASYEDEQFVKELAKKYRLPSQIERLRGRPQSTAETYLREQRLKFFNKALAQTNNSIIATGHNLDDNVETFLMRLVKGSRLKGLLAIRPVQGPFIRPLLMIERREIRNYAKLHHLGYREDITNLDTTILRNRIRHQIIPYLKKELDENLNENIAKVISNLNEHHQIYEQRLKEALPQTVRKTKNGILLSRKRYQQYGIAIRRGLIEYCISAIYPLNYVISD